MHASESRTERGRRGEDLVSGLLEAEDWRILSRNYRAGRGEVDIIAWNGEALAFVEVKNWSVFDSEDLGTAISEGKRRRIIETSKIFLSRNREYSSARVRYDVFLLREGRVVRRLESAFTGES
jgi:putative endonuclease